MLRNQHRSPKLFSDFNNFQFAGVFGTVVFVVLLLFMTDRSHYHSGYVVDLPSVLHPVSMPWANREDALVITVTRDGKLFFGVRQVTPAELPGEINQRLKDHMVERRVYIKADMRARWGSVRPALDAVHQAGILRVSILVNQRRVSSF